MKVSSYLDLKKIDYEIRSRPSGENYIMICPFCGGGEEKRKTFAINANSGLWNCMRKNNCNESGTFYQLQERLGDKPVKIDPYVKKDINKNKNYIIPAIIKIPLSKDSLSYLTKERCFTKEMIEQFDLFEDIKSRIAFPYYKNGNIINVKYRSKYTKEDMRQCQGAEPVLYNRDKVEGHELLLIIEGECLSKGAEILTSSGWVKLENYGGEDVLQYNEDGSGSFIKPLAYVKKKYKGKLIQNKSKGFLSITTPKHNMVAIDNKGRIRKHPSNKRGSSADIIPRTLILDGPGIELTKQQITLCLAERKLPIEWLSLATKEQRDFIIQKLVRWNGNHDFGRNQYEYSSKYYENATWVQTLCHTNGIISTIMKRKNEFGKWYKVSILPNENRTLWQSIHTSEIDYDDYVYCVQVPSGMIMVRQEDKVTVTGNCDCIALTQYGVKNVVSVPNGVDDLRWIENEWDFLDKFKEIYIIMDNDAAGIRAVSTLVNRLGIWRCKSITLPYKDANKCLQEGVSNEEIFECFQDAEEFMPVEIKSAGNFCEEVKDIFKNPDRYKGVPTGFPELDKIIKGYRQGELTIWTGQSGSGKTTILNQSCLYQASKSTKCCIASLELRPARYLKWAIQQTLGKENPTEEEIDKAFKWLDEWIYVLDMQDEVCGSKIFELFEYTTRKYGISQFVIDSLMMVALNGEDDNMSQVKFTKDYKKFAKKFGVHCHLVAHPKKQEDDKSKPGKSDVKGRTEITDVADNVVIIWRNIDDDHEDLEINERIDGMVIVRKNREFGDLGSFPIYFDPLSRRYRCKNQYSFFDI